MATFISTIKFTEQGIQNFKDNGNRQGRQIEQPACHGKRF